MRYTEKYTTRWHDTDAFRRVRPTQLLVYMQETSNRHMKSRGMSLDELRDQKGLAFILSRIRLAIYSPLYSEEDIEVTTWTYAVKGIGTGRYYRIERNGELIADADTLWALVDIREKKLVNAELCGYGFEHEELPKMDIPLRFRLPAGAELMKIDERLTSYSDLDYNMHMNNTKYADMLMDHIPLERTSEVRGFVLSYLHEASAGEILDIYRAEEGDSYYFRTFNGEGRVCLEAQVIVG